MRACMRVRVRAVVGIKSRGSLPSALSPAIFAFLYQFILVNKLMSLILAHLYTDISIGSKLPRLASNL